MGENNLKVEELEKNEEKEIKKESIERNTNDNEIKKKSKKRIIIISSIIAIIVLFLIIISTIFALLNINNSNIVSGVKKEGIDVSGLSKE